jgi:hypothetical protein
VVAEGSPFVGGLSGRDPVTLGAMLRVFARLAATVAILLGVCVVGYLVAPTWPATWRPLRWLGLGIASIALEGIGEAVIDHVRRRRTRTSLLLERDGRKSLRR